MFLVLCVCLALISYINRNCTHEQRTKAQKRNSKIIAWSIAGICVLSGYLLWEKSPQLPRGVDPSIVKFPIASYSEMKKDTIFGRTVIISEVPRDSKNLSRIKEKQFDNCQILGPAVVTPEGFDRVFTQCEFGILNNDIESIFLEAKGSSISGTIGIRDCKFSQCKFAFLTFAGNKDFLDKMRAGINSKTPFNP